MVNYSQQGVLSMKFDLLCLLQVISNYAYDIHYSAKGGFFYSDHIFSERLGDRDEFADIQDDLIETLWLGRGEEAPKSADISAKVAEMTPEVLPETDKNFKTLRELIIGALVMIEQMTGLRMGEQDIIGSIAHILQRHNGLLYRQLVYTPEEVQNSNEAWDNLVKPDDTMGTKENSKGFWQGLKAPFQKLFNDRWITVKRDHGDEDEKGRHLKLEDGETPKDAMKRQWGVDLDKKKDTDKKPEEKKTETPEEKKSEPTETKTEQYKTPTAEWAELLDKEKKEGLSDAEKARKKELIDKDGFEDPNKEKRISEMTDDELESYGHDTREKLVDLGNIADQKAQEAFETDQEALDLQKKRDEIQKKLDNLPDANGRWELQTEIGAINARLRSRLGELQDKFRETEEYESVRTSLKKYKDEHFRREDERRKKESDFSQSIRERLQKIDTDDLPEEQALKEIESMKQEVADSGMSYSTTSSLNTMLDRAKITAGHSQRTRDMPNKLKEYSKKNDSIIKEFESFNDPYEKWKKDADESQARLREMQKKRDEEKDPEKKKALSDEIFNYILNAHMAGVGTNLNKIKYDRSVGIANILRKQNDTGSKVSTGRSTIKGIYDKLNGVLSGVIGKNVSTENAPEVRALKGRAYYDPSHNLFKVERDSDFGDVIHEYTHFLEKNNPNMLKNSLAFAEYRTNGENYASLSQLTGVRSYRSTEIAKKDRFFSPYCGKIYSNEKEYKTASASEIMSMGVERLFREPAKFAKEDREYFDFVVANLRGEL